MQYSSHTYKEPVLPSGGVVGGVVTIAVDRETYLFHTLTYTFKNSPTKYINETLLQVNPCTCIHMLLKQYERTVYYF